MTSDDRLTATLVDLAEHIEFPVERDLAPAVLRAFAAPAPRASHRRRRVIAIAVASVLALFVLPGPREAVADFFGLSTVHIVRVNDVPDTLGTNLRLGREVPVNEVASPAFTVLAPASAGGP